MSKKMTPAEESLCQSILAGMQTAQVTPATSYTLLHALTDGLAAAGSEDPEGKALAFLFFVMMKTAQAAHQSRGNSR